MDSTKTQEFTLPYPETINTMSKEDLLDRFKQITGVVGACLRAREEMIQEMEKREMYDPKAPSSLQQIADMVAKNLDISPPPKIPFALIGKERDLTGLWTNTRGMTALVRAFLTCDCGQELSRGLCSMCDNDV